MAGFLDKFRKKITASVWKNETDVPQVKNIDDKIALGVLLWVVAEADNKFLPEEEDEIKEILLSSAKIPEKDILLILASVREAARERIDLYTFTHEVSKNLPYSVKISIIEALFCVACSDKELDEKEVGVIRKISGLFHVAHKDFINAKMKVKKRFKLDSFDF